MIKLQQSSGFLSFTLDVILMSSLSRNKKNNVKLMLGSNCLANLGVTVACTLPQQEVSLVINMVVSVYEKQRCLCTQNVSLYQQRYISTEQ